MKPIFPCPMFHPGSEVWWVEKRNETIIRIKGGVVKSIEIDIAFGVFYYVNGEEDAFAESDLSGSMLYWLDKANAQ